MAIWHKQVSTGIDSVVDNPEIVALHRRWLQHHPGTVPVLEGSGRTFAEVAAERLGETAEVTA